MVGPAVAVNRQAAPSQLQSQQPAAPCRAQGVCSTAHAVRDAVRVLGFVFSADHVCVGMCMLSQFVLFVGWPRWGLLLQSPWLSQQLAMGADSRMAQQQEAVCGPSAGSAGSMHCVHSSSGSLAVGGLKKKKRCHQLHLCMRSSTASTCSMQGTACSTRLLWQKHHQQLFDPE